MTTRTTAATAPASVPARVQYGPGVPIPTPQPWAAAMATTLADANTAAHTARATGQTTLNTETLATIRNHYHGAVTLGISTNSARAGPLATGAHPHPHRPGRLHPVQSYLSTATKWGLGTLDVLTQLFTAQPWLPPAPKPC